MDSFWKNVDRTQGQDRCWPWIGKRRHPMGYGMATVDGVARTASSVAWELTHGPIAMEGTWRKLSVCHSCDNPACCNPAHLFLGTHRQNMADSAAKGRRNHRQELRDAIRDCDLSERGALSQLARRFGVSRQRIHQIKQSMSKSA